MSAVTDYRRGFFNGIIAYGVSFIKSHLEPWRVLFLIEGLVTILFGVLALTILPESIEKARWLTGEEKDYREFQFDICARADLSALAKELRVFG
jgi:MFS family permease